MRKYFPFILVIITVIVRLIPAMYTPIVGDLTHWWKAGQAVLHGKNPYVGDGPLYPYPPAWMWIEAGAVWLSQFFHLPFAVVIKIPLIFSDAVIAVLVYVLSLKQSKTFYKGLFYALNPVAILITGFHGQFDTLPVCMILLAIFYFKRKQLKRSGLFLGLGIAIKSFPILLLPLFLIYLKKSKEKITYAFLSLLPILLLLTPYVVLNFYEVYKSLLSYSGWTDHGWIGIYRAFYWLIHNSIYIPIPYVEGLLQLSKIIFLCLYTFFLLRFSWSKKQSLLNATVFIFILFYFIYGGISSQYLVWILPFIILLNTNLALFYSFFATLALLGYYSFFLPRLLLWLFPFITVSPHMEQIIKSTVFENSGQLLKNTPLVHFIRSALWFYLLTAIVFWLFVGYVLKLYLTKKQ